MAKQVDKLRESLFAAKDGAKACTAINKLGNLAKEADNQAKQVLADYARTGRIDHMREHACSCLAEAVTQADAQLAEMFLQGLADSHLRYWSILGISNAAGKGAYGELKKVAENTSLTLSQRCHAVKCLARVSKQQFDRNLPSDPGRWKEKDLRLTEIMSWASSGYPDGPGYSPPTRHPALENPRTPFERIISRLDKKLSKNRQERQDLADPTAWLAIAAPDDIESITARWELPSIYLDFLTRFSPIKVTLKSREFYNHFQVFGAAELIGAQEGYSFNPIDQKPIEFWPVNLVVIASHGGDPFVLDLSKSDGKDAPVDTAEHGMGVWDFNRVADSFTEFMETLAK